MSPIDFDDIFTSDRDESLSVRTLDRGAWEVTRKLEPSLPREPGYVVGEPKRLKRWLSIERLMAYWMEPKHGRGQLDVNRDSFMLGLEREDARYVVALPLSGTSDDCNAYVRADNAQVVLHGRNEGSSAGQIRLVVTVSSDLQNAIDSAFQHAKSHFTIGTSSSNAYWNDGLYWCSWNAFYDKVTEDDILHALKSIADLGIQLDGAIIDDGWQDVDDQRRLRSFRPNQKFPHGLKWLVEQIKSRHPSIQHVGVWHALMGYWNGIAPDSAIARAYKTTSCPNDIWLCTEGVDQPRALLCVDDVDIHRFYDDFYRFLASQDISTTKADAQAAIDQFDKTSPHHRRLWRPYQDALEAASAKYMDSRVIYCMSHVNNAFFHSLLGPGRFNRAPVLLRNSDDFFPDRPDSHSWHIHVNVMNNLYTTRLYCVPDWDMFETGHEHGALHAAGRAISGGPVLITDGIGKTNLKLIEKLTSKHPMTGNLKVLRFQSGAWPLRPFQGFGEAQLTHIVNERAHIFTDVIFNLHETALLQHFSSTDLGLDGDYAFWQESSGDVRLDAISDNKLFSLDLKPREFDRIVAAPLRQLSHWQVATFGLLDKYAGGAAVAVIGSTEALSIELDYFGLLGLLIAGQRDVSVDISIKGRRLPKGAVKSRDLAFGVLLEIDVPGAWAVLGLDGRPPYEILVRLS
ncbi:hypothetical protein PYCC9005_003764 [Savitreella phatthalungensis]